MGGEGTGLGAKHISVHCADSRMQICGQANKETVIHILIMSHRVTGESKPSRCNAASLTGRAK